MCTQLAAAGLDSAQKKKEKMGKKATEHESHVAAGSGRRSPRPAFYPGSQAAVGAADL